MKSGKLLLLLTFNYCFVFSQTDSLEYYKTTGYLNWNWEAMVIRNNYISTAIVPSMGGNILQYDFGIDTFLILNPLTYGLIYDPIKGESPFSQDWGFGGIETWCSPEQWPPSPVLTFGKYHDTLLFRTADSIILRLSSETEINTFPGIKFEKQITVYKNSTLIKYQNSMVNDGANLVNIGMMNVAEVQTQHAFLEDFQNFRVYFPIRKNSIFGSKCVRISPFSKAFLGEIEPGIYGVEYTPERGKVFSDSPEGWIAFVDERDEQTYVCLYDIDDKAEYPDLGANTEVYVENNVNFMAIEAMSPLVNLSPNLDTLVFTEYFASTSLKGPILRANLTGAVSERLHYDSLSHLLTGKFGVFSKSSIQLVYCDSTGNILEKGTIYQAVPDTQILINETVELPDNTAFIELRGFDFSGKFIDIIDVEDFEEDEFVSSLTSQEFIQKAANKILFLYARGELNISLYLEKDDFLKIELINSAGNIERNLFSDNILSGKSFLVFSLSDLLCGIYIVRISGKDYHQTSKIVVFE